MLDPLPVSLKHSENAVSVRGEISTGAVDWFPLRLSKQEDVFVRETANAEGVME